MDGLYHFLMTDLIYRVGRTVISKSEIEIYVVSSKEY